MKYPESLFSRREFLNGYVAALTACLSAFAAYPVVRFILPWKKEEEPDSIVMSDVPDLQPGEGMAFAYGPSPAILIRMKEVKEGEQEFRAFNAVCTHFDCTCRYLEQSKQIHCACHDGYYDLEGNVTAGPPPRPLKRYELKETKKGLVIAQPGLLEQALKETETDVATG
jgi:Rieske Fe-S protein